MYYRGHLVNHIDTPSLIEHLARYDALKILINKTSMH